MAVYMLREKSNIERIITIQLIRALAVFRDVTPPMPVSASTMVRTSAWVAPSSRMSGAVATPKRLRMTPVQIALAHILQVSR